LLDQFRNKKSYLISTALITFAILAKLFVPIAHASNASSNQKSFFASICSGHQVLITLNLTQDEKPSATHKSSNKCPLCSIIAQDGVITSNVDFALNFPEKQLSFHAIIASLKTDSETNLHAIRAPPTTLLIKK